MELPAGILLLPQTVERESGENTIYPVIASTPKGLLLVDTGYEGAVDQIRASLVEAGCGLDDIHGVVITH